MSTTERLTFETYHRLRRQDRRLPARVALSMARSLDLAATFWNADPGNAIEAAEWRADGYQYRAEVVYDDNPDTSWLGEFTDDPTDAIPTGGGRGEYAYFRPGNPGAENYPYYRAAGYGRDEARAECAELDRQAMELAREPEFYGVRVTASLMGRTLGDASCWGVDDSSHLLPYCAEVARDLASEAAYEADRTLARKLGTAAELIA